ncbi:MAG TPA: 3-oxoacyl-ACP reductase family protein [Pyrinomonadaceae bacterium]|nr:3-oxoacyl-ACP reductase family protein [Pyrinomonadaceae bacterium]
MANETLQLRDRVAIVTGGSRGIGRAVVDRLAEMGAHIVVNYVRDSAAADAAVASARSKRVEALAVHADISKLGDAERLINETVQRFKRIDILVCNAGIWEGAAVEEISEELWDRTMDVNLKGTWTVCRAAVPVMKRHRSGRIVIVSSTAGQRGEANVSNYAASKGGQISFTKSLAPELAPFGINVNAVAPGWVDTELNKALFADPDQLNSVMRTIPLGKMATADDIACPIVFLCSDWARHITGEILNVNGGSVLCG